MTSDLVVYNGLMEHLSQSMVKSQSGIELDTTQISVIDTDQYTSYTFKIKQDSLERQYLLKNFMLTVVNDTTLIQHLVEYPVLTDGSINVEAVDMQRLYGEDLLDTTSFKCGGTSTVWFSYQQTYSWNCGGVTGNSKHGPGDDTCKAKGGDRAGFKTVTMWSSFVVNEEPCQSIGSANGPAGRTRGTNPNGSNNQIVVPANPTDPNIPNLCLSDGNGGCMNRGDLVQPVDKAQEYLNTLLKNVSLKANIQKLQNELNTFTHETGFSLSTSFADEKKPLTENTPLTVSQYQADPADPHNIIIPFDMGVKVSGHMHLKSKTTTTTTGNTISTVVDTNIPMFSPPDIHTFNDNMKFVYNSLRAGYEPDEIAAILDDFCDIVVTEKGNYMIKYNGTGEEITDIDLGDEFSTDPAELARYNTVMDKYKKLVQFKPEAGIVQFIEFLSPGNNFEVYKFDLTGNITKLN
jgi:hypothetical protein